MLTRAEKLRRFLDYLGVSNHEFAELIGVSDEEADKLLGEIPVGYDTAHNFIYLMKAYVAQHYIDWEAMGICNPLRRWHTIVEDDAESEESIDDDYDPEDDEDEFDSTTYFNPDIEEDDLYGDEDFYYEDCKEDKDNG